MIEFDYMDQEGLELLAATIIRTAYEDLLDAYLMDAAIKFRNISYNCHKLYEKIQPKKGRYCYDNRRGNFGRSDAEIERNAKQDIKNLTAWFLSEDFKFYSVNAKGEWFVKQAKIKACLFVQDKITITDTHVVLNHVQGVSERSQKRQIAKWKRERDKWRTLNRIAEVKDEDAM